MTILTPNGRGLGRKPDAPDPRDRLYAAVHAAPVAIPGSVDLRSKLPPCFDQGQTSSCGPNAGSGLMCFFYSKVNAFSRLQIYYGVRQAEGDVGVDGGVETRDVLGELQVTGAAPETLWPFDPSRIFTEPPASVYEAAEGYIVGSYSRLVSATDYLNCLAAGFPFLLGFSVYESLDGDAVAKSGVMPLPSPGEKELGGHDVLAVGYDTNFLKNPDFIRSGLSPSQVSNSALLIRNSWGAGWGLEGHFWMPLEFAADPTNGGDAWTARLTPAQKDHSMTNPAVTGAKIDPDEITAVALAVKQVVSTFTYMGVSVGNHVTDDECRQVAAAAIVADRNFNSGKVI